MVEQISGFGDRPDVVAFGEVLWDVFPGGRRRLGGAPANFAVHAAAMGAGVGLVSCVGGDPEGKDALARLRARGVDTAWVREDLERPTGIVRVSLADGEPTYEIVEGVAWDALRWEDRLRAPARRANAICFGTLALRCEANREVLRRFVAASPEGCLKVLDLNFRQQFHSAEVVRSTLGYADILKLNREEVAILRGYTGGGADVLQAVRRQYRVELVVITLGSEGCRVLGPHGDVYVPTEPQAVVNTVGAGDAFTAAFVLHFLKGADVRTCAERANEAGGYVTTQDDGMPAFPGRFRVFG